MSKIGELRFSQALVNVRLMTAGAFSLAYNREPVRFTVNVQKIIEYSFRHYMDY